MGKLRSVYDVSNVRLSLFVLFIVTTCLVSHANCYFVTGTQWTVRYWGTTQPEPTVIQGLISLKSSSDLKDMEMWYAHNQDLPDNRIILYVKTEGEKIYFRYPDDVDRKYYLLYDFGLKPGDGCYVYSPDIFNSTCSVYKSYLKCDEIIENSSYDNWPIMKMSEYKDESCAVLLGCGIWIQGLSSERGVLNSNRFEIDGFQSKLVEVRDSSGVVVYDDVASSVQSVAMQGDINITINDREISISADGDRDIFIYTVSGLLLYQAKLRNQSTSFCLRNGGIYVIKSGDFVREILIY